MPILSSNTAKLSIIESRNVFRFKQANWTVFAYEQGKIRAYSNPREKSDRYTRRCFVMSRTVLQFRKFARFDPRAAPLTDQELAARVAFDVGKIVRREDDRRSTLRVDPRDEFANRLADLGTKRGARGSAREVSRRASLISQ